MMRGRLLDPPPGSRLLLTYLVTYLLTYLVVYLLSQMVRGRLLDPPPGSQLTGLQLLAGCPLGPYASSRVQASIDFSAPG